MAKKKRPSENITTPISRPMAFLRRDYTLNEERIFLNTCILAKSPLDESGHYKGDFGEVTVVKDPKGKPTMIEAVFYVSKIMGGDVKKGNAYKHYDEIRKAFKSYNLKHLYALAPNGVDWIDVPPFAMTLSNIKDGKIYTKTLPEVWNLFVNAGGSYNRINAVAAYRLSSRYALRIYEMFSGLDKPLTMMTPTLKECFCHENRYKNNKDFLKRVIYRSISDLAAEGIVIPIEVNKEGNHKTAPVKSITFYPDNDNNKQKLIVAARKYGLRQYLGEKETACLLHVFEEKEIINNLDLFLYVKWRSQVDLCKKIEELSSKSAGKDNPKGWIISVLKSIPPRKISPLPLHM